MARYQLRNNNNNNNNNRLGMGKFRFASRVCEKWNRLGDGIVSAGTENVFKTRLDHHLRNVRAPEGVFISVCFLPLPMTIHDGIFMDGSW